MDATRYRVRIEFIAGLTTIGKDLPVQIVRMLEGSGIFTGASGFLMAFDPALKLRCESCGVKCEAHEVRTRRGMRWLFCKDCFAAAAARIRGGYQANVDTSSPVQPPRVGTSAVVPSAKSRTERS